jgi:small subunit ribosomal protein S20
MADGNTKEAEKSMQAAYSALDKAAKKGVIHKNTASRKKSRLAKLVGATKTATNLKAKTKKAA